MSNNVIVPQVTSDLQKHSQRSRWMVLLLVFSVFAVLAVLVGYKIKPISLRNRASLAAPVVRLSWALVDRST